MSGRGLAVLGAEYRTRHPWLTFSISKNESRTASDRRQASTSIHEVATFRVLFTEKSRFHLILRITARSDERPSVLLAHADE
jgi:hypothetical protein